ncbi:MAG TPA: PIN domain nuclease [Campylobacterales bacterium]|nr:PIN domain nuclease [Campylobacterales bacterium]
MYLVDTSVLIDFFKGIENSKTRKLEQIIQYKIPFGISALTYQEVLQGAKDQKEFDTLNQYLSTQHIYYPPQESYEQAARIFFQCRKSGVTIRSTIDALIATTAIEYRLILLAKDKDFDNMAKVVSDLSLE